MADIIAPHGFTPHHGGPMPVESHVPVELHYRGPAKEGPGLVRINYANAGRMDWTHDGGPNDITAWRIIEWNAA